MSDPHVPLHDEVIRGRPRPDPPRHHQRPRAGARQRDAVRGVPRSDYLSAHGVEAELVAREAAPGQPRGADPGVSTGSTAEAPESLAFVGHTDVVPCDPRDWTHPPFEAVVDDDGWLWGRGAVDMKNEVAARAVAMAELARSGFRPRGDLWFIAVADEEDGFADVGMRWLLEERPDIRPTHSVNEGGGERLPLVRRPRGASATRSARRARSRCRSPRVGEAGHASVPTLGRNAVPLLAQLLPRLGDGLPEPTPAPEAIAMLRALLGRDEPDLRRGAGRGRPAARRARRLDPGADGLDAGADHAVGLEQAQRDAGPGHRRGRLPDPPGHHAGRRRGPGADRARRRHRLRARVARGDGPGVELPGRTASSRPRSRRSSSREGDPGDAAADAVHGLHRQQLPARGRRHPGLRVQPVPSPRRTRCSRPATTTPNERVHVDDLLLSTRFHIDLAHRVLG